MGLTPPPAKLAHFRGQIYSGSAGLGEGSETKEALGRSQLLPYKRGTSTHGTLGYGPTSVGVSKAFINHAVSETPAICQNPTHQLLRVGKHEGAKPRYLCLRVQRKSQLSRKGTDLASVSEVTANTSCYGLGVSQKFEGDGPNPIMRQGGKWGLVKGAWATGN